MFSFTAMAQIHQGDSKGDHDSTEERAQVGNHSITTILSDDEGRPVIGAYYDINGTYKLVGIGDTELRAKMNLIENIEIDSVHATSNINDKNDKSIRSYVLIYFCVNTNSGDRCISRNLEIDAKWRPDLTEHKSNLISVPEGLFLRGAIDWTLEHSDAVSIFSNYTKGSLVEQVYMLPIKNVGKVYKTETCRDDEDTTTFYYEI